MGLYISIDGGLSWTRFKGKVPMVPVMEIEIHPPLLPAPFAKRGVTLLSGVVVEKPEKLLRIVSEGGGTRQFGDAVRKLSIRCREASHPEPPL